MKLPNGIKERAWPGFSSWAVSALATLAVFEFLALLAWHNEQGRIPDITTALVTIPAGLALLMLAAAIIFRVTARLPLQASLTWLGRVLPFIWAVPVFDLIRTYGRGLVISPPLLDGNALLSAFLTGGLLPLASGISIGIRLGMFASVLGVGFVIYFVTHKLMRSIAGGLLFSVVLVMYVSIVSAISLSYRLLHGLGWSAIRNEVSRSAVSAVSNGYWWNALYERFPTAVEAQSTIALRLAEAGAILFALGLILTIVFFWLSPRAGRIMRHAFWSWSGLNIALYFVFGFGTALVLAKPVAFTLTWWCAFGVAVFAVSALRFASVLRRSLHQLKDDEANGADQPIVRGDLSVTDAHDIATLCEWYAVAAGWVLGWPVLAMFLIYLAASHLTRDRKSPTLSWLPMLYRSAGASALAVAGFLFGSQEAAFGPVALALTVLAVFYRVFSERVIFGKK